MSRILIFVSSSHVVAVDGHRVAIAEEMELKRAAEVKVPTCTGEEPIWIVAEGVWGRQLGNGVHVDAPKGAVGVPAWQIWVLVNGGPQV